MTVYVDPPEGWQYGFPKSWDQVIPLDVFLIDSGYPIERIDFALKHMRIIKSEESPIISSDFVIDK